MPNPTFYLQDCPTCGRRLQIRVEYLGKRVACERCRGRFIASDPASRVASAEAGEALMRRAEELLESASRTMSYPRVGYPR